ncbi:exodeoxyribonuclease I [Solemya pervernicosa gill symbiont]|uniref:Exodeoxyribonuclease I n=2 Tax=Gammaproteobacteria incertae sedis TaxID=118884 RepID=A0A1T2L529_9GAMM|nr:exodeoxyribonuclease I [Candidatus Reidiella endopervernicosa]OOZ40218.1 exodeoxyribonuclease I [Solemya pervernicosa gill symbiont]QKQ27126.1 exodeoxyribonuclease I [Candidatus Reidiella endopervernicosa]
MATSKNTIYWHDYETSGIDPARDRPMQFAGIRTDEDLNIVGEPLMIYCKLANDALPHPEACMVTGLTPQEVNEKGVNEAAFIKAIHSELARPGTCGAGFNSIRFDDEFTRFSLYRNFFDPYAREWQSGNTRWDIIDMVRMTRALRPEGIEWPDYDDGKPCFKLERLTEANGISHTAAHDALSDVHATIAVAKLVKDHQPRLYEYIYQLRNKRKVFDQLNVRAMKPVLHTSGMIPGEFGSTALVAPVTNHPSNKNGIIVYDLRFDPTPLLSLDAEEIAKRIFTPRDEMPEGVERIPLKVVHANKCPVVVTPKTMDEAAAERLQIDVATSLQHLEALKGATGLETKIQQAFADRKFDPTSDPDASLYGGGFFSSDDRRKMDKIRATAPDKLANIPAIFDDQRIPELLFRYRGRNWPENFNSEERAEWDEYRHHRLTDETGGGSITLDSYRQRIKELINDSETSEADRQLLKKLEDYGETLLSR